jgi:hypothetical protein
MRFGNQILHTCAHRRTSPPWPLLELVKEASQARNCLNPRTWPTIPTLKPYQWASNWLTLPHLIIRVVYKTALWNYKTRPCRMATQY